jgi:hypothetical protein
VLSYVLILKNDGTVIRSREKMNKEKQRKRERAREGEDCVSE